MSKAEPPSDDPARALAEEAARWFARMRAPDTNASRPAFEAWMSERPENRVAYSQAAEIFALGKLLAQPDPAPAPPPRPRRLATAAVAGVALCTLGLGGWAVTRHAGAPSASLLAGTHDDRTVSTRAGEARVARLADGSTVRLGSDTLLAVTIDAGRRTLRLERGQARFEVAHESRPFVVLAGGGSVTARGTIFEVGLAPSGRVDVRLLQGAIDVALPQEPHAKDAATVRRLVAGESIGFAAAVSEHPGRKEPVTGSAATPTSAREFTAIPVAVLIAEANSGATRPIRLADASLSAERVSGRFRIDDTQLLADRLGALFGGTVDTSNPSEIVLHAPTR